MTDITTTALNALRSLIPPPRLVLSKWLEENVSLPSDSALPGRLKLTTPQIGVADAISDPTIERVTVVKPVRAGFTMIVTGALASSALNDPKSNILLFATDRNCRDYVTSHLEPFFAATPALKGLLEDDAEGAERNTMCSRRSANGFSLKVLSVTAENTLRGHTAQNLYGEEIDAMTPGSEGNGLKLGERRTLSFAQRKIVYGSTPTFLETSPILKSYEQSDQRIFECLMPCCGTFVELLCKEHVRYDRSDSESEVFVECPHCHTLVEEKHKPKMVRNGQWRATRPEVKGHAGFKSNSLISFMPHASWSALRKEYESCRKNPADEQTFWNTLMAEGWTMPAMIDEKDIATRGEPFDLAHLPVEVISLTMGVDVHDNRLVVVIISSTQNQPDKTPETFVLHHEVIFGSFTDVGTWQKLRDLILNTSGLHPLEGRLPVDGVFVDAGDGQHQSFVLRFAAGFPRIRRVWPGRGVVTASADFVKTETTKGRRFALANTTSIKGAIFDMIEHHRGLRFPHTLSEQFYAELASEHQVVHTRQGQQVSRFERIARHTPNHALDALVYAICVRSDVWVPMLRDNFTLARRRLHPSGKNVPPVADDASSTAANEPDLSDAEALRQVEVAVAHDPMLLKNAEAIKLLNEMAAAGATFTFVWPLPENANPATALAGMQLRDFNGRRIRKDGSFIDERPKMPEKV